MTLLQQEIAERVEIMDDCPIFQRDNPGISRREMEFTALLDIENLGDDAGGWLIENNRERRQWRRIRNQAMALLRGDYYDLYTAFRERMAELDRQYAH